MLAEEFGWSFAAVGPLNLGMAVLVSIAVLGIGYWLSLIKVDKTHSIPEGRESWKEEDTFYLFRYPLFKDLSKTCYLQVTSIFLLSYF